MSQEEKTPPTAYETIGGATTLHALVDAFYAEMDSLKEAEVIRKMHAKSLKTANQKLFMFLSGWLGGPQLFVEKYGHPALRRRHFPFAIDESARQQWMLCMNKALEEVIEDVLVRRRLSEAFDGLAAHMRNQP